jgi:hypothetical protein
MPFAISSAAAQTLSVNTTSVVGGANVTVTLANGPGGALDCLRWRVIRADTSYIEYACIGAGIISRKWTVAMPAAGGTQNSDCS